MTPIPQETRGPLQNTSFATVPSLLSKRRFSASVDEPRPDCLIPPAEMEARLVKLRERALFDPSLAKALQTIGSVSEQLTLDVQGRIRVSDKLLQFANLTTTVAMVGSVRLIKLWNPSALGSGDSVDQTAFGKAAKELGF